MAKQPRKPRGRVVLAADAGSYSVTSVSLAVALASSAGSLLQGLFVEDEDLLQITGLPCSREITLTTATERSTSSEQMQRSLRRVAHQFRQTLQQQAQALQVAWCFDTMRGRVRDIGLQPESDVTYTILANPLAHRLQPTRLQPTRLQPTRLQPTRLQPTRLQPTRLQPTRPQVARKILLLGDTSPAQDQALEMLIERYGHEDIELTLAENGHDGGKKPATERWLQRYSRRITLTGLPVKELLARLGQPGLAYDFAILAGYGRGDDKSLLIKALRCPIILIA